MLDSLLAKEVFSPSHFQYRHLSSGVRVVLGDARLTDRHLRKGAILINHAIPFRNAKTLETVVAIGVLRNPVH